MKSINLNVYVLRINSVKDVEINVTFDMNQATSLIFTDTNCALHKVIRRVCPDSSEETKKFTP